MDEPFFRDIGEDRGQVFKHAPFALEQKLIDAVVGGAREDALSALAQIERCGDKAMLSDEPLRSAKNSVICSVTILARAAIRAGVDANSAFALSDAVIREVETLRDRKSVLTFEKNALLRFVNLVNGGRLSAYSFPVGRAVHYVETRLDRRLKLSEIAEYAQVNRNWLSEIFTKEVGECLMSYINRRKIQESAYFVKNRAYRLSDIALFYGFSSQSYYTSVFRRIMGVTPGEYRKGT